MLRRIEVLQNTEEARQAMVDHRCQGVSPSTGPQCSGVGKGHQDEPL